MFVLLRFRHVATCLHRSHQEKVRQNTELEQAQRVLSARVEEASLQARHAALEADMNRYTPRGGASVARVFDIFEVSKWCQLGTGAVWGSHPARFREVPRFQVKVPSKGSRRFQSSK